MEGNYNEPSARFQQPFRPRKPPQQLTQLVVDEYPQPLKRPGCRMFTAGLAMAEHLGDHIGQIERSRERHLRPPRHDGPCDSPRASLFSELENDVGDAIFIEGVDDIGRRGPLLGSSLARSAEHPHVERPVSLEGEPALRLVELHRRDTEIEDNAIELPGKFITAVWISRPREQI